MSLFNMLMGRNPHGPQLMAVLGFFQGAKQNAWLGRFRDVWTNETADKIYILHRNYPENDEYNQAIQQHPNFIKYEPDDDETYGTWEFSVPKEHQDLVKDIASLNDTVSPMIRYRKLIDDMQKGIDNEATRNAFDVGKKILDPIIKGESGNKIITHGDGAVKIFDVNKGEV